MIVKWGLAAIILAIGAVFLVDLVDGPLYSFSTKTWSPELRGDKMIGGIEGAVKDADAATNTVRIASGFLGLASLPLAVTPDTKIAVKGTLGGCADLNPGQFARVAKSSATARRRRCVPPRHRARCHARAPRLLGAPRRPKRRRLPSQARRVLLRPATTRCDRRPRPLADAVLSFLRAQ